jgi:hypothetical protein
MGRAGSAAEREGDRIPQPAELRGRAGPLAA